MRVLVACEFSGTVRNAFLLYGHDAYSCDIEPTENNPDRHFQTDVLNIIDSLPWDLLIAHPPCTYLTNAGVRHLHSVPSKNGKLPLIHGELRFAEMTRAAEFFKRQIGRASCRERV